VSDLTIVNTPYLSEPDAGNSPSSQSLLAGVLYDRAQAQLTRMFRDPYALSKEERAELIDELRISTAAMPEIVELRVLLGMTLCVDMKVQEAVETLREAVKAAPDSFLAHLKLGELLMRLRICDQAQTETQEAARLAANPVQSELARRQAATLRTMMREGIERGGLPLPLKRIAGLWHKLSRRRPSQAPDIALIGPR
jgi:predicted Zn-dependent protease